MKILNNKKLLSALAIMMILSFAASMIAVPNANAVDVVTWPFVDALPNPAGVGQPVLINWGLLNYIPGSNLNDGFNVTLRVTDPNDKVIHNITAKTWSTGNLGRKFSFDTPGNYTIQTLYDSETVGTRTFLSSESEKVTLEIVEGWKGDHPGHSLPFEYWTRPVDSQLREWYSIMGSWVATPNNLYAPFNDGPDSPHILWSMPIGDNQGGLTGGDNWQIGAQNGDAYEGKFAGSIILNGVLFYNKMPSNYALSRQTIVAVDLHTGKVLWERNYDYGGSRVSRGQILTFINQNNRGTWSYIWMVSGTNMFALSPTTGDLVYNMTNVPTGTIYVGPSGEMLKYLVSHNTTTGVLTVQQWNSTYVVEQAYEKAGITSTPAQWGNQVNNPSITTNNNNPAADQRTYGVTAGTTARSYNANATYACDNTWTISGVRNGTTTIVAAFPEDRLVLSNSAASILTDGVYLTGLSLNPEESGVPLFTNRHFPAPSSWEDVAGETTMQSNWVAWSNDPYVAVFWVKDSRIHYGFSLETGRNIWETEPQIFADAWTDSPGREKNIAYGKLYAASVGGILYCYDAATGERLWEQEVKDPYNESYHREAWWLIISAISDGKVYVGHMAHSAQEPKPRGAPFIAFDAETGDIVWQIDGAFRQTRWGGNAVLGDSILVTADSYDQQIYAIGKGPSKMTLTAPNVAVTAGTAALIKGTVMDVSPGTQSDNLQMRYQDGVPAVGDESMSEWMLHLYKQFPEPMRVTGIEITVYAVDSNGQMIQIGTTESDARGTFSIPWTPESEGEYAIWAYFEGTNSYYGSDAKADMYVSAAPVVEPQKTTHYEYYIIGMGIAIIAVVIIFGLLSLRKK